MNRRDFIFGTLAGLGLSSNQLLSVNDSEDSSQKARDLIQSQVDAGVLNAATLYLRLGNNEITHAFGQAESLDAIFLLASITKPMTVTGLMIFYDRGELRLSDNVMKFIPEFSVGDRKDITIEQLLTHTSGLPDQLPENAELRKQHAPLSEFVERAIRTPLLFKPGTQYSYQSMGILLAAEIVQRISKTPISDFLAEQVFKPLDMPRTALGLGSFQLSETIRSQTEFAAPESGSGAAEAKDWDWNSPYWRNFGAPWGGTHGTAKDVAQFLDSFLIPDGTVLKTSTAIKMIQNHNVGLDTRRGLGFKLGSDGFGKGCSDRTFGHGGSTGTLAWADPDNSRLCVILTSLPTRKSRDLILNPVGDLVST